MVLSGYEALTVEMIASPHSRKSEEIRESIRKAMTVRNAQEAIFGS